MKDTIKRILEFTNDRNWDQFHHPENLAKSISIEAAELLECFQWSSEFDHEHVTEELADVIIYCIQMADKLNVDIEEIINNKIDKNELKYPIDKSKSKSTKYNKL